MYSALLTSLLIGYAAAAPSSRIHNRGVGTTFALITTVTNAPDPVKELNRGIWAVASNSNNRAVLVDRSQGALFYEYGLSGSTAVATGSDGFVITPGGTATVPSTNEVELLCNDATSGVNISANDQGIPVLQFEGGAFMACRASFLDPKSPNPNDIVLSYRKAGQRRFADCADVVLISNCIGGGAGQDQVGALGQPINVSCQPN